MRTRSVVLAVFAFTVAIVAAVGLIGVAPTGHPSQPSSLGAARPVATALTQLSTPGPVELETVTSADWAVTRAGLINLEHPRAKQAGLEDGDEPIQVFFHALRHPRHGLFIVDTGIEKALRDAPEQSAMGGLVRAAMKMEKLQVHAPLGVWLAKQRQPLAGVFLTHLHLDHITGMADVPAGTPVYAGPGETTPRAFLNLVTRGSTDRALAGKPPVSEWPFSAEVGAAFEAAVDVFGDGSVWALWVPGHTPGSTAYLVRTPAGPVLLTGDGCHTRWGWEHDVEPGTFTADGPRSVQSFQKLRAFAAAHPEVQVRLGHQH